MFKSNALLPEMARLRRFAMRLTRNNSDADDLVQSSLLRALQKRDLFKEGTNLFSWISRIMFNIFATQYRRTKKHETQYDPSFYIDNASIEPSQEASVDIATVSACMERLSRRHRDILLSVCVKGMSYEEVALEMDIPVGTVRSRLSRARSNLQEMLAPTAPMPFKIHSFNIMPAAIPLCHGIS
ncbi:MAG: RNA polymerase sigma factor [Alphaproteobacteria bacterium]